jgi:hypothetical protein
VAGFGKLQEEANKYWGAFGVALEEKRASFLDNKEKLERR